MRKFLDRLYDGSLAVAGLFLVGIFVVMVGEAVLRKMGSFIPGASELVGWFCAAAGFLALPAIFKRGDMVRVGVLVDKLAPAVRKPLLLACLLLATVFTGYLLWAGTGYVWRGWRSGEMNQGMIEIATWIPQTSLVVGALLLLVAVVDELVTALRAPAPSLKAERPMSMEDLAV
jgi:TRAP-type C4-dicarboxylate transport system permease small subunit